jgi:hypothetical protein
VFLNKHGEATLRYSWSAWTANVLAFARRLEYQEQAGQNRRERGARIELVYGTEVMTTALFGRSERTVYLTAEREDVDRTAGARWSYRATRTLNYGLEAAVTRRGSSDPAAEFVDHRAVLSASYSSGPGYKPMRR